MTILDLGPGELLSATRAVRERLDFTRPVPDDAIRECVATALPARPFTPPGARRPTRSSAGSRSCAGAS